MTDLLPQAYLLGLIALLGVAAIVVGRQILRVRQDELALARLGGNDKAAGGPRDASTLYELASVQLRKRLYTEAQGNLKQALKLADAEKVPAEARALMENALGFTLAAQNNYSAAVRHYRAALRAKADYPVALNNLAFALEKQSKADEARSLYEKVLELEATNKTARKRLAILERRSGQEEGEKGKAS
ncbi:tetratricopeptide repeat protein [Cyanobium sp. Lug-B]|uniref:tetratricopeptide repeat protein n=1 Tax=Cyanobium sp. Lug-B TaxID=2823716 RepID=UPI0020CB9CE8|nr:tetratricopeptide repeat protein [Cyanobium sp. Lug-B]MCP9797949.1 tetratricopeptide repeat protein [Cyanobium sp. Lug-B]